MPAAFRGSHRLAELVAPVSVHLQEFALPALVEGPVLFLQSKVRNSTTGLMGLMHQEERKQKSAAGGSPCGAGSLSQSQLLSLCAFLPV